jgi:tRNA threonylcarbamoyladenosine biosynthesis protein TsaE
MESALKHLADLVALQAEASKFASGLIPAASGGTLITLSGELGAGKTSFTQGVASALGIQESVTSPTFVLEKVYELPEDTGQGFARLIHIDAYRLDGADALRPLGFHELMEDSQNLILLEWPERVAEGVASALIKITLAVEGEGRTISYA